MKSVAFYNAKAGVGCTSLVYHLAWMYTRLGYCVVAVDADPQRDLTGHLLGFENLPYVEYDEERPAGATFTDAIAYGVTDARSFITEVTPSLGLVRGSAIFEEMAAEFSDAHGLCYSGARSRIPEDLATSRIRRLIVALGELCDVVLIDAGAGLGVAPCLAVTAADALVWAVAAESTAIEGLVDGAHAASRWSTRWQIHVDRVLDPRAIERRRMHDQSFYEIGAAPLEVLDERDAASLGRGPRPLGYVVTGAPHYSGLLENHLRLGRRSDAELERIAEDYSRLYAGPDSDACLGVLTSWVDLLRQGLEHNKPMFELTPADGALGSTAVAVRRCADEYEALARRLAQRLGLPERQEPRPAH